MSAHHKNHPYHIIDLSPWPILTSTALFFVCLFGVLAMHDNQLGKILFICAVLSLITCLFHWWKDVIKEGLVEKQHTKAVRAGLKMGVILFILTEVAFFGAFFASFFKSRLDPVGILDDVWIVAEGIWPPKNIETIDPWGIPFLNTMILLLSGTCTTWAHNALKEKNKKDFINALQCTIALGIIFLSFQVYEYIHASFKFTDGIYSTNFYMTTGFHGVHVLIGVIFLSVCLYRGYKDHFFVDKDGHLGFEFASWYWHFVDAVWLFLFIFMYVLGR